MDPADITSSQQHVDANPVFRGSFEWVETPSPAWLDSVENGPLSEAHRGAHHAHDNFGNSAPGLMTQDELIDAQEPEDEIKSLKGSRPVSIQWQDLEYAHPVCDALYCAICKNPFYRPVTTIACGHTFCFSCLDTYLTTKQARDEAPCPMCRSTLRFTPSAHAPLAEQVSNPCNRIIDDLLGQAVVKCPNKGGLCGWEGFRSLAEKHVRDECDYTLVPCAEIDCLQKMSRGSAYLLKGCLHRKEQCAYCHLSIDMSRLYEHLEDVCLAHKAPCEACGKRVERRQLSIHTEACWETVTNCEFASDGCSVVSTRRQIGHHTQSCIYGAVRKLGVRLAQNESTTETMRRENQKMRQDLCDNRGILDTTQRKQQRVERQLQRALADLDSLRQVQETWSNETGPGLISSFTELEKRMNDLAIEIRRQNGLQSQFMTSDMAQWKQEVADAKGQIGGLVTQVRRLLEYQNRQKQSAADGLAGTSGSSTEASSTGNERESRRVAAEPRSRASSNEPRPSL